MSESQPIANVMAINLPDREMQGILGILFQSQSRDQGYRLVWHAKLDTVSVLLIDAENKKLVKKWQNYAAQKDCPPLVYICNEDATALTPDMLKRACTRPIKNHKLLDVLDSVLGKVSRKVAPPVVYDIYDELDELDDQFVMVKSSSSSAAA